MSAKDQINSVKLYEVGNKKTISDNFFLNQTEDQQQQSKQISLKPNKNKGIMTFVPFVGNLSEQSEVNLSSSNSQSQFSISPYDVQFQMMRLMTIVQINLQELIEQSIFQHAVLDDVGLMRTLLMEFHTATIEKAVLHGTFDQDRFQLLVMEDRTIEHFIFMEYPSLFQYNGIQEKIVFYEQMTHDQFQAAFIQLHFEQSIQNIIQELQQLDLFQFAQDQELFQSRKYSQGPLDILMNKNDLFNDIHKFSKSDKNLNDGSFNVTIRKPKQKNQYQNNSTSYQPSISYNKQLPNSLNINQKQKDVNEKFSYQKYIKKIQQEKKQKQQLQQKTKLLEINQQRKSQFDEILGKSSQSSDKYLQKYIAPFSKSDPEASIKNNKALQNDNSFQTNSISSAFQIQKIGNYQNIINKIQGSTAYQNNNPLGNNVINKQKNIHSINQTNKSIQLKPSIANQSLKQMSINAITFSQTDNSKNKLIKQGQNIIEGTANNLIVTNLINNNSKSIENKNSVINPQQINNVCPVYRAQTINGNKQPNTQMTNLQKLKNTCSNQANIDLPSFSKIQNTQNNQFKIQAYTQKGLTFNSINKNTLSSSNCNPQQSFSNPFKQNSSPAINLASLQKSSYTQSSQLQNIETFKGLGIPSYKNYQMNIPSLNTANTRPQQNMSSYSLADNKYVPNQTNTQINFGLSTISTLSSTNQQNINASKMLNNQQGSYPNGQIYYKLNNGTDNHKNILFDQKNNQINNQINTQMNNRLNGQLNNQINSQINNQANSQINSLMNSRMNSQINSQINFSILKSRIPVLNNVQNNTLFLSNNLLLADDQNRSGIQIPKISMPQATSQIVIQSSSIEKTDKCQITQISDMTLNQYLNNHLKQQLKNLYNQIYTEALLVKTWMFAQFKSIQQYSINQSSNRIIQMNNNNDYILKKNQQTSHKTDQKCDKLSAKHSQYQIALKLSQNLNQIQTKQLTKDQSYIQKSKNKKWNFFEKCLQKQCSKLDDIEFMQSKAFQKLNQIEIQIQSALLNQQQQFDTVSNDHISLQQSQILQSLHKLELWLKQFVSKQQNQNINHQQLNKVGSVEKNQNFEQLKLIYQTLNGIQNSLNSLSSSFQLYRQVSNYQKKNIGLAKKNYQY